MSWMENLGIVQKKHLDMKQSLLSSKVGFPAKQTSKYINTLDVSKGGEDYYCFEVGHFVSPFSNLSYVVA